MEEKKKRMSPILIIILTIIGICLVGFCVWYGINYFKEEEKPNNPIDEPSSVIEQQEPTNNDIGEKIDFPQKSDDNAILLNGFYELLSTDEIKTNFKNLKKEKNGNTFVYSCEKYLSNYSICTEASLKINNKITLKNVLIDEFDYDMLDDQDFLSTILEFLHHDVNGMIYKVGNYYIEVNYIGSGVDLNTITIYNDSNQVYTNNLVKTFYTIDADLEGEEITVTPVIVNNILHFIEQVDVSNNKLKYNTIDLSKDKIEVKLVKEFTGYYSGEK